MSETLKPKVLVIGGGPGGYVAAIRAGQLGLDTILVEADRLGGTCLIRGCIPSKAMIHAADTWDGVNAAARPGHALGIRLSAPPTLDFSATLAWKAGIVERLSNGVEHLLARAKVKVLHGWAVFSDAKTCVVNTSSGVITIRAEHVILATGSVSTELPTLPFGGKVISSTEALSLAELPRELVIIGGGYIGLELGCAFTKLGAQVTIVEQQSQLLLTYDPKLTAPVKRWLEQRGVELHLGCTVIGMKGEGIEVSDASGERRVLEADKVLVTIGRRPLTSGWGLDAMALAMDGSFVKVDEHCATSTTNVWAIGDLVGEPMLAHKASAQGEMVAEIIAGKRRAFKPACIAAVCFTEPEIVSVGALPTAPSPECETIVGTFPFQANGRALSMEAGDPGCFVRVVARRSDHRIVGIQAVGRHVSELSGQFATLLEMGAVLEDVAGIIHAHPTLGEALHESALHALGHPIHN
jgi:dihydrolipoamide dehydrogenase